MSVVWGGGTLGVAYFVVETAHLFIMSDAAEREDFGLLRRGQCSQLLLVYRKLYCVCVCVQCCYRCNLV